MKQCVILFVIVVSAFCISYAESVAISPFELNAGSVPNTPLDACVLDVLREHKIEPANLCSDEVFIRRLYLDVIGTLPSAQEARQFISNQHVGKRKALIDIVLKRKEFADYGSLKWCDVLRVKAEYPINLWPNAVQAYRRWIFDAVRDNMPYDQFARELLTSSGSNFRVPPVNFFRAIQGRKPSDIADAAALTFMGVRTSLWPQARRQELEAFFSQVAYKSTAEWKEEIVYPDPTPREAFKGVFPDGSTVMILPGDDPREVFAKWLTKPGNPWFARAAVNRVWSWLMGRGIIHEPDDIRPDNPAVNPKLLAYLETELVNSHYDLKHIFRLILNSRTYQQSSIPRSSDPNAGALLAYYPVRQLDAEVLIDALCLIGGTEVKYSSAIPEPFTFIPDDHRTIELADGSTTSQFLEMFGRPARDTGLESERNSRPTDVQRLYMLNSSDVRNKITRSPLLRKIVDANKGKPKDIISALYLTLLSRTPTAAESEAVGNYFKTKRGKPNEAMEDVAWALINSKEFLYRH